MTIPATTVEGPDQYDYGLSQGSPSDQHHWGEYNNEPDLSNELEVIKDACEKTKKLCWLAIGLRRQSIKRRKKANQSRAVANEKLGKANGSSGQTNQKPAKAEARGQYQSEPFRSLSVPQPRGGLLDSKLWRSKLEDLVDITTI